VAGLNRPVIGFATPEEAIDHFFKRCDPATGLMPMRGWRHIREKDTMRAA